MMNTNKLSPLLRQAVLKSFPRVKINVSNQYRSRHICALVADETRVFHPKTVTQTNIFQKRFKKGRKGRGNQQKDVEDEEDDDEDDEDELANENPLLVDDILGSSSDGSEQLTISVSSLRLDTFGKTAFSMLRNKFEEAFYKGEIYVNGEKAPKKSLDLSLDDEIDLVRQINAEDRNKLDVKRVQIVKLPDKTDDMGRMKVDIKRWMNLTIDAYEKRDE